MARQGTAKDAILAQQTLVSKPGQNVTQGMKDMLNAAGTPPQQQSAPAVNQEVALNAPKTMPLNPTPTPRVEGQWNYGTAENQVLGQAPTPIQPPTPATPASDKPKTASEAIAQGFKQELKPIQAPITTEIGREQRLGQLPVTTSGANIDEQNRINEQNLKNASGKQLWDNMNTISSGNSKLLTDRKAFDQAFGYEGKDAGEKALVDAFWKSKQPSTSDLYNALATNSDIPATAKNTPWYNDALLRHQDVTRFENLNPYALSKVIGTELIPGTQTYNDLLAKNPKLVQDANKLASINTPVTAREEKQNWQDVLSGYLTRSPAMQNPTTVATIMNSDPAIAAKTNEVQAIEDKLTEAKNRLQNIKANVTERYKGTGATSATINAKALSESRDITNEITMLEANKASASGALTTLIQNAKDNYTFARQDKLDAENRFNQGFQQLQAMAEMGMKQDDAAYKRQQDAVDRDMKLMQYYNDIEQTNMRDELGFQRDLSKMDLQQKYGVQNDLRNFEQQKQLAQMGYQNQAYLQDRQFGQQAGLQSQAQQMDMLKTLISQGVPYNDAVAQLSGQTGQSKDMYVADFIKGKEGFREQAYLDSAGVPTVGYGFTSINGQPVKMGDTITREQADAEFAKQVGRYQNFKNLVNVQLSPQQEAALTSFEYNLGSGIWNKKTGGAQGVIDAINSGDFQKAGDLMKQFNKAGGQTVQGLVNRRNEEANLISQGIQNTQPQTSQYPSYVKYVESGALPPGIKEGTYKAQEFQKQAEQGYIDAKNKTFNQAGLELSNPQAYASTTQKQKDDINQAISQIEPFNQSMDRLIKLVEEHGTEVPWTTAGKQIGQEVRNAQLIAKEIYNLGVLNGPDLSLMEAIIQNPTSFGANTIGTIQDYPQFLRDAKQTIMSNALSKANNVGIGQLGQSSSSPVQISESDIKSLASQYMSNH